MIWRRLLPYYNLYRNTAEQLIVTQQELIEERSRRIAAEALAQERKGQVAEAHQYAREAIAGKDDANKARIASLDLVNTHLLKALEPHKEEVPRKLGDYKPIPKVIPAARKADLDLFNMLASKTKKVN